MTSAEATCSVIECGTECGEPIKCAGYCYRHYMKQWRYGTPTPEHPRRYTDITGQRFGTLVVSHRSGSAWLCRCDCGRSRLVSAGDLNRRGAANTCGDRTTHGRRDDISYSGAHMRVRSDRGPASKQQCVDCEKRARHWSYNHDDPAELLAYGHSAEPIAYSVDPAHYSPRCTSCHKLHDLNRLRSTQQHLLGGDGR